MDWTFLYETSVSLLRAAPLTIELGGISLVFGTILAIPLALSRLSGIFLLEWISRTYVFLVRGTPLLAQLFLVYYGLGQFYGVRHSVFWPLLREPYWCAVITLSLNLAAYSAEIFRGGLLSVPLGQIEAARACGMSRPLLYRRVVLPLAIRQSLPGYGNDIISIIKATSLCSIITISEITGVAAKIIADTYRVTEVFVAAAGIYMAINFLLIRAVAVVEHQLGAHLRQPKLATFGLENQNGV